MTSESDTSRFFGGLHAVKAALMRSASDIRCVYVQKGRRDSRLRDLRSLAEKHDISCNEVPRRMLDDWVGDLQHQGVVAELIQKANGPRPELHAFLEEQQSIRGSAAPLILLLDGVQDPHNLGACLRSADASGVTAVVAPADNSVGLTAVARKVASGAAETVPFFQVPNLRRAITDLKSLGIWVFGADSRATDELYSLELDGPVALVMGSEGDGLRRLTRESCDGLFHLPMAGSVESLNVSVAAGICLFEAVRQRR
ncbi:MAG: 23S rRNA (guanosine(2251)-2'-O)-methyltransferase RlmB [Granulosicoccus sp.]